MLAGESYFLYVPVYSLIALSIQYVEGERNRKVGSRGSNLFMVHVLLWFSLLIILFETIYRA